MPLLDTSPTVGLTEQIALAIEGLISEPSVSVPIVYGTNPAETATADPLELPDGSTPGS